VVRQIIDIIAQLILKSFYCSNLPRFNVFKSRMLEIFDLFASRQHASAEIRAAALTRMKTRHRLVTASPQTHAKESISFERKKVATLCGIRLKGIPWQHETCQGIHLKRLFFPLHGWKWVLNPEFRHRSDCFPWGLRRRSAERERI